MKVLLRSIRDMGACLPWSTAARLGLWRGIGAPVQFVIEPADWAIRWVGEHVRDEIERIAPGIIETTQRPERIVERVVHFGSQYMWLTWGPHMSGTNRYVTSFFHGKPEDGPEVARHIEAFLTSVPDLSRVVTAAGLVHRRLLSWGVPPEKIVRIPIGVDTTLFRFRTDEERSAARARFNIPDDAVVVGSFQKDGVGWGDGMEPKSIKGPDVFLAVMEKLKRSVPVMAFLTGPARGYVKQGLERLGIPMVHTYAAAHADLVDCYHALDLYFVTSREEGGPMGLMEAMSSGVPVISTAVGMAPDLIQPGETGELVESEDIDAFAGAAARVLALPARAAALRRAARQAVMVADWRVVGRDHYEKVYRPLLAQ